MFDDEENFSPVKILFTLAVIFALIGGIWWMIDTIDRQGIENRIARNVQLADQAAGRINAARTEWSNNNQFYADHWSAGLSELLTQAEKDFTSTGVYQDLDLASQALTDGDRATAKQYLTNAETRINQSATVINQILGPPDGSAPGLYVQLANWASMADDQITQVQSCIAVTQPQLLGMQSSVNFALGAADLANAQIMLDQAIAANTLPVERGVVDKPQAFTLAQSAFTLCSRALTDAAPPPPTPEPDHNPTIIIIDNSGDSGGSDSGTDWWSSPSDSGFDWSSDDSGWDSGSDSGSWDSGSWDSGSDSSWDSGSDSWDSGSDSGSWDSGDW